MSLVLAYTIQGVRKLNIRQETTMPYVNIQITKGATRDQKAQLVKEVTASLVRVLGKKPEHTHIVIQEIAEEDWGFSGLLTDDWKKQQASQSETEI
jgi:4-oxalocrotonate tautomerase